MSSAERLPEYVPSSWELVPGLHPCSGPQVQVFGIEGLEGSSREGLLVGTRFERRVCCKSGEGAWASSVL